MENRFIEVISEVFEGVFSNWDSVLKYPLSVCDELRKHISKGYIDTSFDRNTYLEAWLDTRMCYGITGENEVDLIRWFYRNIADVSIKKENEISESISPAKVQITFIEYRFGPFKNEKPTPVAEGEPSGLPEPGRIYRSPNDEGREKLLDYATDLEASGRYIKQLGKAKDA